MLSWQSWKITNCKSMSLPGIFSALSCPFQFAFFFLSSQLFLSLPNPEVFKVSCPSCPNSSNSLRVPRQSCNPCFFPYGKFQLAAWSFRHSTRIFYYRYIPTRSSLLRAPSQFSVFLTHFVIHILRSACFRTRLNLGKSATVHNQLMKKKI